MWIAADAVSSEIESIENDIQNVAEEVNKLSQVIGDLLDKAIAFGINVIIAIIIFIIGRIVIKKLIRLVDKILEKSAVDIGVVKFLHSLLNIALYIVLVIIICDVVGVDTTSFAALVASGGLAIGLAFEGSLSNFAGGILILIMKPFSVGDYIESNGVEGTVSKIDIFYTSLSTADNKSVKLPNGTLSNSILTNYSMHDKRRVEVGVGISYNDDIKKAKEVLVDIMNSYERILKNDNNSVVVKSLGDSSVNLEIRMWVATENYWDATFYLNENIKIVFEKQNITIPYNQLDVRIVPNEK